MIFRKMTEYHGESECGRYVINRSNTLGGGKYMAVRLRGSVILTVESFDEGDDAGRTDAWNEAVGACERDARLVA